MKHLFFSSLLTLGLFSSAIGQEVDSMALFQEMLDAYVDSVENTLHYEYGNIELGDGIARLDVPEGYKYLGPEGSMTVLVDLWGNPPSETLGMLFPEDMSPLGENFTFAIEISYSEEGYIDDEEAEDIDYDDLLEGMQEDAEASNQSRIELGYEPIEIVGWAAAPFYDQATNKLHWAKELRFGDSEINTLNYNIRVLGRKGFLTMNVIGDIDVLPLVNQNLDQVIASAEFTDGNLYSDFDPGIDKVAAVGIGGLIAGKVLAKAGFFAVLLKFWKLIALGVVGAFGVLRKRIFGSKE